MRRLTLDSLAVIILAALVWIGPLSAPAGAFHFPWDQGHDVFVPEDEDEDDDDCTDCCDRQGSPLVLLTGNFIYRHQDFQIPGSVVLELTRTYNSRDRRNGPLGHGWSFIYDKRLIPTTDGVDVWALCRTGEGRRARFSLNPDQVTYTPPPDLTSVLGKETDGWTLTERDGQVRRFDADGRLVEWLLPNGNGLSFAYDGVGFLHEVGTTTGRTLTLTKGANGRIDSIVDHTGRVFRYSYDGDGNLASFADPLGNTTQYVYDGKHNLIRIVDPRGNVAQQMTYDADDRLATYTEQGETWAVTYLPNQNRTTRRDAAGNTWTFNYDADGFVTEIVDPLGGSVSRVYDANKRMLSSTDERGNATTFAYDGSGNVTSITDPLNQVTTFTHVPGTSLLKSETSPNGHVTAYEYDASNNLIRLIADQNEPTERATTFEYDAAGNLTREIEFGGRELSFTYDAVGNLVQETTPSETISHEYDGLGNVTRTTDGAGGATTFTYDAVGRRLTATNALGETTTHEYDASGNTTGITFPDSTEIEFEYDQYGRKTKISDATGAQVTFEYDAGGEITHMVDRLGNHTYYQYDALDRMTKRIEKIGDTAPTADSDDVVYSYAYDASGNLINRVFPNLSGVLREYDFAGRVTSETDTVGRVQTFAYTETGLLQTHTFPSGRQVDYEYDSDGVLTSVADNLSPVASYVYDVAKNLTELSHGGSAAKTFEYDADDRVVREGHPTLGDVTFSYEGADRLAERVDALGNATSFDYDALGRLAAITDRLGNQKSYSYDASRAQTAITDENGNTTQYEHDEVGRLLRTIYPEGDAVSSTYDGNGNLLTMSNARGQTTLFEYDDFDRLARVVYPDSPATTFTYSKEGYLLSAINSDSDVRFTYDSAGRITSITRDGRTLGIAFRPNDQGLDLTFPDGRTYFGPADVRGRPLGWRESDGTSIVTYGYSDADLLTSATYANGVDSELVYDAGDVLSSITHRNASGAFYSKRLERDPKGNVLRARDDVDAAQAQTFSYDAEDQLLEMRRGVIVSNAIPSPTREVEYVLDPAGNSATITRGGVPENRTFNANNQIATIGSEVVVYDADGNLTDDGQFIYVYDSQNRLTEVRDKATGVTETSYAYDALGYLSSRTSAAGVETYFWLGNALIERRSGIQVDVYLPGIRVPQVAVIIRGTERFYLHTDWVDNVVAVTDAAGDVVETYQYDPYGTTSVLVGSEPPQASSSIGNIFLFGSHVYDADAGLYLFLVRAYRPGLAVFVSRDPAGYVDGLNLYSYVQNNPVNRLDAVGTTHTVVVSLRANVAFGALGGAFGATHWATARVTHVSLWQREQPTGNDCCTPSSRTAPEYQVSERKVVVDATVNITIDPAQINRRGPGGQRWYIDCNNVFDVRLLTPAAAAAGMGRPVPVTAAMTRTHELYHVSVAERLTRQRLAAIHNPITLCPLDRSRVNAWKTAQEAALRANAQAFLQGNPNESSEEQNARNHACP